MKIAALIPRRPDGGRRDQLLEFCRAWWSERMPELALIEGLHLDGPFNRAAAINTAAAQAPDADVYVVLDGDVVLEEDQLAAAAKQATETGRMTLAFETYRPLSEQMTDRVLAGYEGDWRKGIDRRAKVMRNHVSSCVAVPAELFREVGGFDDRFVGWGAEDVAFAAACRTLAGGIDRIPGDVFHLWHPWTPERNPSSPLFKACERLAGRYRATVDPAAMRALLAERVPGAVLQVIVTNGRRDCITAAIETFGRRLAGPITRRVIVDDSGDIDYQAWLRVTFPDHELITTRGRTGFDGAYRTVWDTIVSSGQPYAFVIEEDFTLERDVDLVDLARLLDERPHLTQVALRRQPWFPGEVVAGGIIELNPDAYEDHQLHLEHREFVTTNPALWRRDFVAAHPWPTGAHSEARFTADVFKDPAARSAYWGTRTDAPWVIHDGPRTGTGY